MPQLRELILDAVLARFLVPFPRRTLKMNDDLRKSLESMGFDSIKERRKREINWRLQDSRRGVLCIVYREALVCFLPFDRELIEHTVHTGKQILALLGEEGPLHVESVGFGTGPGLVNPFPSELVMTLEEKSRSITSRFEQTEQLLTRVLGEPHEVNVRLLGHKTGWGKTVLSLEGHYGNDNPDPKSVSITYDVTLDDPKPLDDVGNTMDSLFRELWSALNDGIVEAISK